MAKKKLLIEINTTKRSFWAFLANALAPHDEIIRREARETYPKDHSENLGNKGQPHFNYTRPARHIGSI